MGTVYGSVFFGEVNEGFALRDRKRINHTHTRVITRWGGRRSSCCSSGGETGRSAPWTPTAVCHVICVSSRCHFLWRGGDRKTCCCVYYHKRKEKAVDVIRSIPSMPTK